MTMFAPLLEALLLGGATETRPHLSRWLQSQLDNPHLHLHGLWSAISCGGPLVLHLQGCSCSLVLPFLSCFSDLQIYPPKENLRLPVRSAAVAELKIYFFTNVELTYSSFSVI